MARRESLDQRDRAARSPIPPSADVRTDDWPAQAAASVERVVGSVRDKTTGPAITVARAVVYGTFAIFVGIMVLVLFTVAAVRFIDAYLPDSVFGEHHIWAAYLIVGALFTIIGMWMWSRRTRSGD